MKNDPFKIQEGSVKDSKLKGFSENRHSGDYLDFIWVKSSQTLGSFFAENKSHRLFQIFLLVLFILFRIFFYNNGENMRKLLFCLAIINAIIIDCILS